MFEKRDVCAEWDMAWFCCGCGAMKSWKNKGYFKFGRGGPYCHECKTRMEKGEKINRPKGRY